MPRKRTDMKKIREVLRLRYSRGRVVDDCASHGTSET